MARCALANLTDANPKGKTSCQSHGKPWKIGSRPSSRCTCIFKKIDLHCSGSATSARARGGSLRPASACIWGGGTRRRATLAVADGELPPSMPRAMPTPMSWRPCMPVAMACNELKSGGHCSCWHHCHCHMALLAPLALAARRPGERRQGTMTAAGRPSAE